MNRNSEFIKGNSTQIRGTAVDHARAGGAASATGKQQQIIEFSPSWRTRTGAITRAAPKLPFETRQTRTLAWDPSDNNFHSSFPLRGCSGSDTAALSDTVRRWTSSEDLPGRSFLFLWPGLAFFFYSSFSVNVPGTFFFLYVKYKKKERKKRGRRIEE